MRHWVSFWIMLHAAVVYADASSEAQEHVARANRWLDALQYEKAIEEYQLAYQVDGKVKRLYHMAESYDQMTDMADSAAEAVRSKRRALKLYETFLAKTQDTDSEMEPFRKGAAARIEPLRQEIQELVAQVADQEVSLKEIRDGIRQLLIEVRALRELILRPHRGGVPTSFPQ